MYNLTGISDQVAKNLVRSPKKKGDREMTT